MLPLGFRTPGARRERAIPGRPRSVVSLGRLEHPGPSILSSALDIGCSHSHTYSGCRLGVKPFHPLSTPSRMAGRLGVCKRFIPASGAIGSQYHRRGPQAKILYVVHVTERGGAYPGPGLQAQQSRRQG